MNRKRRLQALIASRRAVLRKVRKELPPPTKIVPDKRQGLKRKEWERARSLDWMTEG